MILFTIVSLVFPLMSLAVAVLVLGQTVSYVRNEVLGNGPSTEGKEGSL
jgi:hypothetical protein